MKTKEFKELFNHAEESFNGGNDRVVLVTNNPSVGGRCRLPVKYVSSGFDWERGDILIEVEDKIYSKEVSDFQLVSKLIYGIEPRTWEMIRASGDDKDSRRYILSAMGKIMDKLNKK